MVIDSFIFFNEKELAELRVKYLDPVVDFFVVIEADITHQGKKKEWNFPNILDSKLNKFSKKIQYHKLNIDLKKIENEGQTAGGVIIPDTTHEGTRHAEVIAVGPGRVLENGTAYQSDAGMWGDYNSVIGMNKKNSLKKFFNDKEARKHFPSLGAATLSGIIVEGDVNTGLATSVKQFLFGGVLKETN